ncbi:hypothetical protein CEXT_160931 [Caerostris extrusa]|uniref:Uncharacterized protein n=1 Tax=Caerostris extrusa TaxID=172846 RepID=A0AAV4WAD0_CAEEX|nr:hypothetical protein CEXT_160931 [Caerostris extrusa]
MEKVCAPTKPFLFALTRTTKQLVFIKNRKQGTKWKGASQKFVACGSRMGPALPENSTNSPPPARSKVTSQSTMNKNKEGLLENTQFHPPLCQVLQQLILKHSLRYFNSSLLLE